MGKKAKAGKKTQQQKEKQQFLKEWAIVRKEIEKDYASKMLPVAVQEAFLMALQVGGLILHDYFGWGKVRLNRWASKTIDWYDSIFRDYVTIDEVANDFTKLTGCSYALTKEDIQTLEEYGMMGLIEELKMTNQQMAYMHKRIDQGWESTTNRFGEEIL